MFVVPFVQCAIQNIKIPIWNKVSFFITYFCSEEMSLTIICLTTNDYKLSFIKRYNSIVYKH